MFSFFLFLSLAHAAEIITLAPIEVEGIRPSLDSRANIIITSDDIQKTKTRNLSEILRRAAGVDVLSSTQSGNASASIRGGTGGQTLVIIDGVKANDPAESTRSFDWSTLDPNQIERIEILKGPQSIAFGSDALAGAIIVKTKTSKRSFKTQTTVTAEGGSRDTLRSSLLVKHPFDSRFSMQAQLKQRSTKGPTGNAAKVPKGDLDGSDEYSGQIRAQAFFNTIEATVGADRQYTHSDLDAGALSDDLNFISRTLESRYFLQTTAKISSDLKSDFLISRVLTRRVYGDPSSSDSIYRGARWDFENRYETRFSNAFTFLWGAEAKREELKIDSKLFPVTLREDHQDSVGLFSQGLFAITPATDFDLGVRYDHYDSAGSTFNFRTGLRSKLSQTLTANIGLGSGFKAPSLYSLYDSLYGNQNLKPERSHTGEAGIEYVAHQDFKTEVQVFQTEARDLFGSNPTTFQSINFARARIRGVEWQNEIHPLSSLTVRTHFTFLHARNLKTQTNLPNRSRLKGGITLERYWNDFYQTHLEWIAKSRPQGGAPGFGIFNVNHTVSLSTKLSANARIENILNKDYQEVSGYHSPRRSVFAGLEYKF